MSAIMSTFAQYSPTEADTSGKMKTGTSIVFRLGSLLHGRLCALCLDLCLASCLLPAVAQLRQFNPLVPDYLADPSISKFGDTYYLFGTTDIGRGLEQAGPPVVWTSKDFVNWSFEGSYLQGIDWSQPYPYVTPSGETRTGYFRLWAPSRVTRHGQEYWLYATLVRPEGKAATYLLVARHPEGPYRFAQGEGLFPPGQERSDSPAVVPDIDGEPFFDTDGQGWLLWRRRNIARLSPDGRSIVAGSQRTLYTLRGGYSEGPAMFRREGIYYYIYTQSGHQNYANAYMMSWDSPQYGFDAPEANDLFLFSSPAAGIWGPGHGNVFYEPDRDEYFFCYLEYGEGGTTRQVCVNRMDFDENGEIIVMRPDRQGVGYLAPSRERRLNLALSASLTASSRRDSRRVKVLMETRPDEPLEDSLSIREMSRVFDFGADKAADMSNATCWKADARDSLPWIMMDLGRVRKVREVQMAFTCPTGGHSWLLEKSRDGRHWKPCAVETRRAVRSPHRALRIGRTRYLRLTVTEGEGGLWEWKVY